MKCCEATLINFEVQYNCIMYFKMNGAPYGNILICISLDIMTVILFCLWKAVQGNVENKRCLLDKISNFCISRIKKKNTIYNSSACRFHRRHSNKD